MESIMKLREVFAYLYKLKNDPLRLWQLVCASLIRKN